MSDHIGHAGVNCHEAQEIIDDYRRRAAESQQTFEMQVDRIHELEAEVHRLHTAEFIGRLPDYVKELETERDKAHDRIDELEADEQNRQDGYYDTVVMLKRAEQKLKLAIAEIEHLKRVIMLLADGAVENERTRILIQRIADQAIEVNDGLP